MATNHAETLDDLQAFVRNGARVQAADSTDEHLVLVLATDDEVRAYELDRETTRRFVDTGLIDQLSGGEGVDGRRRRVPV